MFGSVVNKKSLHTGGFKISQRKKLFFEFRVLVLELINTTGSIQ